MFDSRTVFIGYDPREKDAYEVAHFSISRRASRDIAIMPIALDSLPFLTRPIERRPEGLWCPISQAPMATEFAISRFAVPFLQTSGWAVFVDCDIVCLTDIHELFDLGDPTKAIQVVQHAWQHRSRLRLTYDDRCELIDGNEVAFFVYPAPKRSTIGNWTALETMVNGTPSKQYTDSPIPCLTDHDPFPWTVGACDLHVGKWSIFAADGTRVFDIAHVGAEDAFEERLLSLRILVVKPPVKMDGQIQTTYSRKNWSSVMLWNLNHERNSHLYPDTLNTAPGRDLHNFCWLQDRHIGALPPEWNVLLGEQDVPKDPKILHYTLGGPWFEGWKGGPCDDVWLREQKALRS